MMKILFAVIILLNVNLDSFSQQPSKIIGEWTILEIQTDRVYKNFETDSIVLYDKEDRDNYDKEDVRNSINALFVMMSTFAINFLDSNTYVSKFYNMEETGEYLFDPKNSVIILKGPMSPDTLKLTDKGYLESEMSDDYDKNIFTFKRRVQLTGP